MSRTFDRYTRRKCRLAAAERQRTLSGTSTIGRRCDRTRRFLYRTPAASPPFHSSAASHRRHQACHDACDCPRAGFPRSENGLPDDVQINNRQRTSITKWFQRRRLGVSIRPLRHCTRKNQPRCFGSGAWTSSAGPVSAHPSPFPEAVAATFHPRATLILQTLDLEA